MAQPQTPAQRLIAQYERLSTPPPPDKSTYHRQYCHAEKKSAPGIASSAKDRSPIRQSLRNLLSVFKKARKTDAPSSSGDSLHTSPRKKLTGSLLYLSSGPSASPGWTNCSVTLDARNLILSFTGDADLSVHEITLSDCTDIRSLSSSQLDHIPDGDKFKVFEVLFLGKPRERFAARSVRERAGWISAIWDAILPHHEKEGVPNKIRGEDISTENTRTLPVQSPIPTFPLQMNSLLDPSPSGRSLPPLPSTASPDENKNTKASNLHLNLSELKPPFSPSIYPPTSAAPETTVSYFSLGDKPETLHPLLRVDTSTTSVRNVGRGNSSVVISPSLYPPTSRPGSVSPIGSTAGSTFSSSSRSSSPSVANLSQLSVVRQRLAQIERNHSQLSSQSGFTGITARVSTPVPVSPAGPGWSKREAVLHNTSNRKSQQPSSLKDREIRGPPDSHNIKARQTDQTNVPSRISHSSDHHSGPNKANNYVKETHSPGPSKDDIRKLSKDLDEIKNVLGGESGYPTIHEMVVSLDHHTQGEKKALKAIQGTLRSLSERVTGAISTASAEAAKAAGSAKAHQSTSDRTGEAILKALKELDERVSTEFSALACKIKNVKEVQEKGNITELHALAPPAASSAEDCKPVDLRPTLAKLEEIRALCESRPMSLKDQRQDSQEDPKLSEHLVKILSLVQEDSNKQTLLAQQQADSVRYLNELNSWLEAFVHNGTSQIQGISANVDHLCSELGCNTDPVPGGIDLKNGNQSNLVNDIRQLMMGMKARDQNFAALQVAVHSLLEVLTASQTQKEADSYAIAGLMDRQRHDQEVLFRAFTNEISGEIKGERLRFVEAMKEATTINVQLHVEHFKQELSREVMAMTEEVGRLHREKQVVENQISDLFAFYSKHKQVGMPLQTTKSNTGIPPLHLQDEPRANIPRSHQRLVPYPH